MWEIADCLYDLPIRVAPDLIQQQRKQNWRGKDEDEVQKADKQRVAQQTPEIGRVEKLNEVSEPNPGASEWTLPRPKVLESDKHAPHGQVLEEEKVHQPRKHQYVGVPIEPDSLAE